MEFEDFKKGYTKRVCADFYQKFWAGTALANGLTIKTPEGKEIMVNPKDIYVTDLGGMNGNCKCGHAIRYEYWLGEVGPIGSSCIKTMTGLDGQDLRAILRGAENARFETKVLEEAKVKWETLDKQLETDKDLKIKLDIVIAAKKLPPEIQPFLENDIPLPYSMVQKIVRLGRANVDINRVIVKYGTEVAELVSDYKETVYNIGKIIHPVPLIVKKLITQNIYDLGYAIMNLKASDKAVELFKKLIKNGKNPLFMDALDVIKKLQAFGPKLGDFWSKIVQENYEKGIQYGFSDAQINFILLTSSTGKPGLAIRFAKYLDGTEVPPELPTFIPPEEPKTELQPEPQTVPDTSNPF